jgi:hypothetical protein
MSSQGRQRHTAARQTLRSAQNMFKRVRAARTTRVVSSRGRTWEAALPTPITFHAMAHSSCPSPCFWPARTHLQVGPDADPTKLHEATTLAEQRNQPGDHVNAASDVLIQEASNILLPEAPIAARGYGRDPQAAEIIIVCLCTHGAATISFKPCKERRPGSIMLARSLCH